MVIFYLFYQLECFYKETILSFSYPMEQESRTKCLIFSLYLPVFKIRKRPYYLWKGTLYLSAMMNSRTYAYLMGLNPLYIIPEAQTVQFGATASLFQMSLQIL